MKDFLRQIGRRLRRHRLASHLGVRALGRSAGVPASTISHIENEAWNGKLASLYKLAAALNLNVKDLMP